MKRDNIIKIFKKLSPYLGINYAIFIFDLQLLRKKYPTKPKTLLLVRLDAIGDYVISRNFIESIKESEKYKDYSVTLCGNVLWREIAEKFDAPFVDEFIWIQRNRFYSDLNYRKQIMSEIRAKGFEIVMQSVYSREFLFGDAIIKISGAERRIGSAGDLSNMNYIQRAFSNVFYTDILPADKNVMFEFYRSREFFEEFLGEKVEFLKPNFSFIDGPRLRKKIVVIMPGASTMIRQWNSSNFAKVAKYLHDKYQFEIIIAGGPQDRKVAEKIVAEAGGISIKNVAGKVGLKDFIDLVSEASILISNETSSVHIGVATDTMTICVSKGNRFGRFDPYPQEIANNIFYVYPPEIRKKIEDVKFLETTYSGESNLDLNSIAPEDVIGKIEEGFSQSIIKN